MADAMYAPVVTRFLTYDVALDDECAAYGRRIMALPDMVEWVAAARAEPDEIEEQTWNGVFGGDVPGVGCYALAESVKKRPEVVQAFVNALVKATDIVRGASPEAIADIVYEPFLSGFPRESVVRGLTVYKQTWNYTNVIPKDGYDRLLGIMAGRQFTPEELKKTPYETMVDMSFVRKARG